MFFSIVKLFLLLSLFWASLAQEADDAEEILQERSSTLKDMMFETTGYCDFASLSNKSLCVPYKDLSFAHIWDEYPPEVIKTMVNKKIRSNPHFNEKLEARIVDGEKVQLFARDDIDEKEVLFAFNYKDSLSCSEINRKLFSDEFTALKKHKKLPQLFNYEDKTDHFERFLNMMISLLLHLYNFEHSLIKEELLLLPRSLEEFEFVKYTPYEIENLMKGDEIQSEYKSYFTYFVEGYKVFQEAVFNSWSKELVLELFHVEEFPYQDFVYGLMIYFMRYENKMLPSIFHGSRFKQPNKPKDYKIFEYEWLNKSIISESNPLMDYQRVKVLSPRKFTKDERLVLDYSRVDAAAYMMTGEYDGELDTLENECFDIFWLNEESSKRYNEPIYSCLTRELIFHYYTFVNYINLIGKDFSECYKIVEALPSRNMSFNKAKDEVIYNQCIHPEWQTDLFDFAERQLEERVDNFLFLVNKIKTYEGFRAEKGLPYRRAIVLRKYFEMRLKLLDVLKKELKKFRKINREYRNKKIKTEL